LCEEQTTLWDTVLTKKEGKKKIVESAIFCCTRQQKSSNKSRSSELQKKILRIILRNILFVGL